MVLYDKDCDRYRLHDLMRDVARGPLWPDEDEPAWEQRFAQAAARHAAHYRTVLASADELYRQGGAATAAGLALYDLEQRNIGAGVAWALARAAQDDETRRLAAAHYNAGAYVLDLRLHPRECIRRSEPAVEACRRLGDRRGEGAC